MNKKKIIWAITFIISIALTIICITLIALHLMGGNYNRQTLLNPVEETTNFSETSDSQPDNPINFKHLKKINPDIYAWITIPNTKVDYPILQAGDDKDDFFYLTHNINQKYEFAGSIYSELHNTKDFSDPVTVIYGHNMLNGTMFASLHKFEDSKFFKKNKYIYIYTPERKLTYKIYAAYVYDDRHILNSFDFSDNEVLADYFESTLNPTSLSSHVRKGIELNTEDKILTLSTCTSGAGNTRYLVQGVLEKDAQTQK